VKRNDAHAQSVLVLALQNQKVWLQNLVLRVAAKSCSCSWYCKSSFFRRAKWIFFIL